jgi:large subunit ribosomal protein L31
MKKGIHPEYKAIKVHLADGSVFETRSTMDVKEYRSEVDSTNHPFYTGKRQYVDTAGRVEKFRRRYGKNAIGAGGAEEEKEGE